MELKPGQYWVCVIGPSSKPLPTGCDAPLRNAVRDAFEALFGAEDGVCYSGWGADEKLATAVLDAWNRRVDPDREYKRLVLENQNKLMEYMAELVSQIHNGKSVPLPLMNQCTITDAAIDALEDE